MWDWLFCLVVYFPGPLHGRMQSKGLEEKDMGSQREITPHVKISTLLLPDHKIVRKAMMLRCCLHFSHFQLLPSARFPGVVSSWENSPPHVVAESCPCCKYLELCRKKTKVLIEMLSFDIYKTMICRPSGYSTLGTIRHRSAQKLLWNWKTICSFVVTFCKKESLDVKNFPFFLVQPLCRKLPFTGVSGVTSKSI